MVSTATVSRGNPVLSSWVVNAKIISFPQQWPKEGYRDSNSFHKYICFRHISRALGIELWSAPQTLSSCLHVASITAVFLRATRMLPGKITKWSKVAFLGRIIGEQSASPLLQLTSQSPGLISHVLLPLHPI